MVNANLRSSADIDVGRCIEEVLKEVEVDDGKDALFGFVLGGPANGFSLFNTVDTVVVVVVIVLSS